MTEGTLTKTDGSTTTEFCTLTGQISSVTPRSAPVSMGKTSTREGGFGGLLLGLFFGGVVGFFYFVVQFSISLLFNFQKNSRGGGGGVMRYCIDFAFFIVTILLVGVFHVCKNTYKEPQ